MGSVRSPYGLSEPVTCAIIGYGGAFNMGKHHAEWIHSTGRMRVVAICDIDEERLEAARSDFPDVSTYSSVTQLLSKHEFDLAVIVTPHNTHAPIALQCLRSGKHVVVEKPMCITIREATAMINESRKRNLMLSVFHNRRWDGDYLAIREVVSKGVVGDVFHIEMFGGGYGHPGRWWRSDKAISGGAFYDWGAHYLDWLLGVMQRRILAVGGFFHKLVWNDVTNEDNVEAVIKFEGGAVAYVQLSHTAAARKPRWFILGTRGAIVDWGEGTLTVNTFINGLRAEAKVPYKESRWQSYYENIAAHLLYGEPLIVKPEQARRTIAIMELAERSSKVGRMLIVPYEDEVELPYLAP
ncbi:MAG: Gfo/Idh/MocA family oxidoreductase [Armatimonadota bacterium]|nr:Gfo/Idh/MocA family oxidoreductase [Armatimonadota bacterium]MDW8025662.1 Gfo/Idh/MocA family oxidoreductase [Armatimonadota bacterium]